MVSSDNILTMAIHYESLPDSKIFILGFSPQLFLQQCYLHVEIATDVRIWNISKIIFVLSSYTTIVTLYESAIWDKDNII